MSDRRSEQELYAVLDALKEWPKLPSPPVLRLIGADAGEFELDWSRGKVMQNELPPGTIPYECNTEIGAGFWDRITNGAWRAESQADSAQGE